MKYCIIVLLFLVSMFQLLPAQKVSWTYDNRYDDKLLYLHSAANYVFPVNDDFIWEQSQFQGTAIRMSFGSVEVNDLLCDYQTSIRHLLIPGIWFTLDQRYYASQHWDEHDKRTDLGFEAKIWRGFSAFFSGNPAFDKEEADVKFGLGWANRNSDQYLRLALCLDDPFYESKNNLAGLAPQYAKGICWQVRLPLRDFWLYSSGKFSSGFKREYPDYIKSPELRRHSQQINRCESKLYYLFSNRALLELVCEYYDYFEQKKITISGAEDHYLYQNKIWMRSFRYSWPFTNQQQLRLIFRCVTQDAKAEGMRNYTYERTEFLPALFYRLRYKNFLTELGYMGSIFDWDYLDSQPQQNYSRRDWTEKVKLAFAYHFNPLSRLELSVSHVLTYWGFGGGNLQFSTLF